MSNKLNNSNAFAFDGYLINPYENIGGSMNLSRLKKIHHVAKTQNKRFANCRFEEKKERPSRVIRATFFFIKFLI